MRNTIHLKLEKGSIVGTGKVSKERLLQAFKKEAFNPSELDTIIEHFCYEGYWIETNHELSNVKL